MKVTRETPISVLRILAKEEADTNILWEILKSSEDDEQVLANMAGNSNLLKDLELISELCRKGDEWLRATIVLNIKENDDLIDKFSDDNKYIVRMAVARNTKKISTMRKLTKDPCWEVRSELLFFNPNIHEEIIRELSKDEHPKIKEKAKNMLIEVNKH